MSISVVIPVHNGARFIADALASVRQQTVRPQEVIVVDDGSTDATSACLAAQPGIRVLTQSNRGPAAARNTGWQAAQGDLVAFLDADDTWSNNTLERLEQCLLDHSQVGIAQGLIQQVSGTDARQRPYQFVNLGSSLFRRAVFDRVGGFDEALWHNEDIDWLLQAWEHGIEKRVLPFVALYYRLHDSNMTRQQNLVAGGVVQLVKRHLHRARSTSYRPEMRRQPWPEYRGAPP